MSPVLIMFASIPVFKLFIEAKKRWKPLKGKNRIAEIIALNVFVDGINQNQLTILNQN
jgi:hypothetical protein